MYIRVYMCTSVYRRGVGDVSSVRTLWHMRGVKLSLIAGSFKRPQRTSYLGEVKNIWETLLWFVATRVCANLEHPVLLLRQLSVEGIDFVFAHEKSMLLSLELLLWDFCFNCCYCWQLLIAELLFLLYWDCYMLGIAFFLPFFLVSLLLISLDFPWSIVASLLQYIYALWNTRTVSHPCVLDISSRKTSYRRWRNRTVRVQLSRQCYGQDCFYYTIIYRPSCKRNSPSFFQVFLLFKNISRVRTSTGTDAGFNFSITKLLFVFSSTDGATGAMFRTESLNSRTHWYGLCERSVLWKNSSNVYVRGIILYCLESQILVRLSTTNDVDRTLSIERERDVDGGTSK